VLALHIVIIFMLQSKSDFLKVNQSAPHYLKYVSIVQPKPLSIHSPRQARSKVKKAELTNKVQPILSSINTPTPDSTSTPTTDLPKLDLNTLRADAVQHELKRERSPIELQEERNRRNQRLEARLEKGANEAKRSDCRTSYAQTGLFAPLFITADLLRDNGCKF
jgi:HD superfamily phosphohydrolase